MLKIVHAEKYFNKNKPNQIHVINDTSLVLPDSGMVMILGPSGSGKTTLLYSLGGLENLDSGSIIYNQTTANSKNWDKIRALEIGYVFQNYFLLNDLNVEDNLRVVLDMFELSEEEKIQRIKDSLEAVGLAHFSHRFPSQLSGGQQQRVAIARALCKNPKMIIADEPTGNLDEANTVAIMNIFKKISQSRLVLMVTHEDRIAKFYADRLIILSDGLIKSDTKNEEKGSYELLEDPHIYLGELTKEEYQSSIGSIEIYNDKNDTHFDELKIVIRNGNYYLYSDKPFKMVDKDMMIEGVKKIEETSDEAAQDAWNPNYAERPLKKHAVSWGKSFKEALKAVFIRSGKKKGLCIAYALTMIITVLSLTMGLMTINLDESNYLTGTKEAVLIKDYQKVSYTVREELIDSDLDLSLLNITLSNLTLNRFMFSSGTISLSSGELVVKDINDNQIIYGANLKNDYEMIADKAWLEAIIKKNNTGNYGFNYPEDFVGATSSINGINFSIVGICDLGEQALYLSKSSYSYVITSNYNVYYHHYGDYSNVYLNYVELNQQITSYTNLQGETVDLAANPLNDYEVLVPNDTYYQESVVTNSANFDSYHPLTDSTVSQHSFKIVGTYETTHESQQFETAYVTKKSLRSVISDVGYLTHFLVVHTSDIKGTQTQLNNWNIKNEDITQYLKSSYYQSVLDDHMGNIIAMIMALVGGLFFIYFMMRSSLMSRIKEIGIKRALGFKKADINRSFLAEILVINVFSIIICLLVYWLFIGSLSDVLSILNYNIQFWMPVSGMLICVLGSLVIGMIPVWKFTSYSPAQAISHYDL